MKFSGLSVPTPFWTLMLNKLSTLGFKSGVEAGGWEGSWSARMTKSGFPEGLRKRSFDRQAGEQALDKEVALHTRQSNVLLTIL